MFEKVISPHSKFRIKFKNEPEFRCTIYTTKNNIAWSKVEDIELCGYVFPPIDSECEIKCKHGWEPCRILAHHNLIVEILSIGTILQINPDTARFRTKHPVFDILKQFGIPVSDELSAALNKVLAD